MRGPTRELVIIYCINGERDDGQPSRIGQQRSHPLLLLSVPSPKLCPVQLQSVVSLHCLPAVDGPHLLLCFCQHFPAKRHSRNPLQGKCCCCCDRRSHWKCLILDFFLQVYNIIPSISSITGISPQRYIWRVCIAVHVGPRFLTSLVYHRYYLALTSRVELAKRKSYLYHVWIAFILNLIEQAALIGVTYVSNRENYREFLKSCLAEYLLSSLHRLYMIHFFNSNSWKDIHSIHDKFPSAHVDCAEVA